MPIENANGPESASMWQATRIGWERGGKRESTALGDQNYYGEHDQSQSKDGKRIRQAFGPGDAPRPHIHRIMNESVQCKGDDQAQWSWRKTSQRGKTEVGQKVANEGIPVPPEAGEF